MKMQISDLIAKVREFAATVLVGKAKSWMTKFAIGAGMEAVADKAEGFIRATGTVAADGFVDIEKLHRIVTAGFGSAGHIDLLGGLLGFDPQDAEELFAYIENPA